MISNGHPCVGWLFLLLMMKPENSACLFIFSAVLICLMSLPLSGLAVEPNEEGLDDPAVEVEICDGHVKVDVEMTIAATPEQVWSVWTDYENLPKFDSSLRESHIVSHQGNLYELRQHGVSQHGPITFTYESRSQDEQIMPYREIHSQLLQGSFKSLTSITRFIAEGGVTRIIYHAESVPGVWLPPLVTKPFIKYGARDHYREMRYEIQRRIKMAEAIAEPH